MKQLYEFDVEFDDGTVERVVADQRDVARWEGHPQWAPDRPFLRSRFMAWSALKRQGNTNVSWERFNERDCAEVRVPEIDEEDGEGEQSPSPPTRGRKARDAAS